MTHDQCPNPSFLGHWSWVIGKLVIGILGFWELGAPTLQAQTGPELARQAQGILKTSCHRCHGQGGSLEGGLNYVLDRDKLVSRKKIVPGHVEQSPLFRLVAGGKMPPAGEAPRPSTAEIEVLRRWIEAGAPGETTAVARQPVGDNEVLTWILADLDQLDRRARRFTRYVSLTALANAGAGPDELQSYRNALAKLLNSLSWHPRISLPKAIDPAGLVLRIDLRDYQWDANLWNRVLTDYPYGIVQDSGIARAVLVRTATRMPIVRLDWFVATASRAPLYYDLLQIPTNLAELERQLRVDVNLDIQQERIVRTGFLGSGISRNNRILERHDAQNGAYWRTYDFEAIPQNLTDRDLLLPDRRDVFAYPLGPGGADTNFQHAGGEVIFNLPNGLHGFVLINANNTRIDKGPIAIVSDPKRPDRAVEVGVSCMSCHASGILQKTDQIRDHVSRNAKAFSRADNELVRALYPPEAKTKGLMEEDTKRYRAALTKTGNTVGSVEVVMTLTLRYEADVDLPTVAAEVGLPAEDLQSRLLRSEVLTRSLGGLKIPGGVVSRQALVQAFGDLVRELRLGVAIQPGLVGLSLPDNTGEVDPLEGQSSPANALSIRRDGKLAALAGADRTVRIFDIEANRDLRRCIGHTASVWAVEFSPDGKQILSGGKDGSVRLWDVETGRELRKFDGHSDLVTSVAFSPDGRRALSADIDGELLLWDLERGTVIKEFACREEVKYPTAAVIAPDGRTCVVCAGRSILLLDAVTGRLIRSLNGHTGWVVQAVLAPDGRKLVSASDDGTVRLWNLDNGQQERTYRGHQTGVKCVAFSPDSTRLVSGGNDSTVRLWDLASGEELKMFAKHSEPLVAVTFIDSGRQTLSASRDGIIHDWDVRRFTASRVSNDPSSAWEKIAPPQIDAAPKHLLPSGDVLRPTKMLPVGASIGSLLVAPDRRYAYYLNLTDAVLVRVDPRTQQRQRLQLAERTEALALSPDGKTLVAIATTRKGQDAECLLQSIDPEAWKIKQIWTFPRLHAHDVAVSDRGQMYLSSGNGEWGEVIVVDGQGNVVGHHGGVWTGSLLQLSQDQKRLYVSTQGVTPGSLEALVLPTRPRDAAQTYRAPRPARHELGGAFQLTPDGRFALCKNGTVLRLTTEHDSDLVFERGIDPFLATALDVEAGTLWVLRVEGTLDRLSYPDFRPQARYKLDIVPTGMANVSSQGMLILSGIDPRRIAEQPRARAHGDVFLYQVSELEVRK
jgi:WD40 repeat protein/mono/diheme cytochrome c family protein